MNALGFLLFFFEGAMRIISSMNERPRVGLYGMRQSAAANRFNKVKSKYHARTLHSAQVYPTDGNCNIDGSRTYNLFSANSRLVSVVDSLS